jgi:triosephosphate isomerase
MGLLAKTLILLNFKAICGADACSLAAQLQKIDSETRDSYDIALAVQPRDIPELTKQTSLPLFIQDCETNNGYDFQRARGILLNHPEKKLPEAQLRKKIEEAQERDLEVIVCSTNLEEAVTLHETYHPHYVAIENEDLIGKPHSFADFCPHLVSDAVGRIENRLLFGGGMKGAGDIHCVVHRGGAGVLVSSAVVKSKTPLQALKNMLQPEPVAV